jgi:hypothetical protein
LISFKRSDDLFSFFIFQSNDQVHWRQWSVAE